ncbi:WD-40 repeat protein, partial [Reticulomyxa filosa]
TVRLWDIRTRQQTQIFNGHTSFVWVVDYSPFVIKNNNEIIGGNVICSGGLDNTIRFWDIRANRNELFIIKGDEKEDNGIFCLKFVSLKKKGKNNEQKTNNDSAVNLCYGLSSNEIHIWG